MYANTYLDASTFADQIIASARDTSPEGSDASRSAYKGLARRRVEDMKGAMQQVAEITSPAATEKAKPYSAAESMANYIASIRKDKAALLDSEGSTGGVGSDTIPLTGSAALQGLADRTEGGGDYNTLYAFSNKDGKKFSNVKITNMSLGDLYKFSATSGEYGQWVKGVNKGVLATPMGRYQFVGSTLQGVADKMGLPADTKFTPEVQDKMFVFHARDLLSRTNDVARKRDIMRKTWVGFNNVPDAELDYAISQITMSTRPKPKVSGI